jgi:CRP-like cAMP-binding protein
MVSSRSGGLSRSKIISSVPYFAGLDPDTLHDVQQAAIPRRYDPGQLVILEGEPSAGIYIIENGWLKVVKIAIDGREQILQFLGPGETFNAVGVFTEKANPASVVALEESTIWLIRQETMLQMLEKHPKLARRIIEDLSGRIQHLISLVEDLSLRTVEARLARLLLEQSRDDKIDRHRWATQSEMAARLGTVPEVVNRSLRKLVDEGMIEVSRKEIRILDRGRLEDRAMVAG